MKRRKATMSKSPGVTLEELYYDEGLTHKNRLPNDSASTPRPSATAWLNTGWPPVPPRTTSCSRTSQGPNWSDSTLPKNRPAPEVAAILGCAVSAVYKEFLHL